MISFVRGVLAGKSLTSAFVDVNGLGLEVFMPAGDLAKLPESGNTVTIQTYFQVRDDAMALYGFSSAEERALFERLIGVSGVGPKVALAALSFYSPAQLVDAVASQDVARVSKIPGVGKKTASRIILELKGSLDDFGFAGDDTSTPAARASAALEGALEALLAMGFTEQEANLALKDAPEEASEGALLQYALKRLGGE